MEYLVDLYNQGYLVSGGLVMIIFLGFYTIEKYSKRDIEALENTVGFILGSVLISVGMIGLIIR